MNKLKYKIILAFCVILVNSGLFISESKAQCDLTLQALKIVPQSNYTNPALRPPMKFYIGLPGGSSIFTTFNHNGFTYRNLVKEGDDDSLHITYRSQNEAISKMTKKNFILVKAYEEVLAGGWQYEQHFFTVSLSEKVDFRFGYPKDLMNLAFNGNAMFIGKTIDLEGLNFDFVHYRELSLGYSIALNDEITLGTHLKLLSGLSNLWMKKNKTTIAIDDLNFGHTAIPDYTVYMSTPDFLNDSINYYRDSIDKIGGIRSPTNTDIKHYMKNFKNFGIALDLGLTYKVSEEMDLGLSFLDLGYIKFRNNTQKFYSVDDANFIYDGYFIKNAILMGREDQTGDSIQQIYIDQLTDSLKNNFSIVNSPNSYWYPLTPKIYLTGQYNLTENDNFGVLIRSEIFNRNVHPSASLFYNRKFGTYISLAASYSAWYRSYTNFGFGFAANGGPAQLYVVTDNITALFVPEKSKNFMIHAGINFIFGYQTKVKGAPLLKGLFRRK
jgi:hypothetical protein